MEYFLLGLITALAILRMLDYHKNQTRRQIIKAKKNLAYKLQRQRKLKKEGIL